MQQSLSLADAFELFILDAQSQNFTKHTLRFYQGRLSLFIDWCNGQAVTHLHELSAPLIRRYFVDMRERELSSAYIHSHARAIRTFGNFCVRDGLLDVSPFDKVKMPRLEKKILPALTSEQVALILKACSTERDKAIVLTLLDSGVRANELVALDVGDVNMRSGVVIVRQGKGQKDRTTYIGAKTRKQVKRYLIERGNPDATEPLFASFKGGTRLTYYGLAQVLRRIKRDADVDTFSAHACRRTFAITCLRNGMDVYVLAKLMGHADITVLRQYLDLVDDDLQKAHRKHGVIDNLL